jgi:hypothetical protein
VDAAWRKRARAGGSLPTGERCPADSGLKPTGACDMRCARVADRTEGRGETDVWAAATVPGGGAADERGPSGSGRGRERRGTDRRDRPVSRRGRRGGCGLRVARVGRPGKGKGGPSPEKQ